MENRKQIIYIIGTGRSGTTLLEILLGNSKGIFNAGELNRYPKRRGIPPLHETQSKTFQFWQRISEELNFSNDELEEQEKLHINFEYHTGFLKWIGGIKEKGIERYHSFLNSLYKLLFNNIDENIITDSSKYPGRAIQLSISLPYDISYIYIKRNPVQVARSFAKQNIEQPPKKWLPANLYYFSVNTLCKVAVSILQKKHKVVEVTYEDLINYPEKMLTQIERDLQIDLSSAIDALRNNNPLSVGMLFDGNRIRMKDNIHLKSNFKSPKYTFKDNLTRAINYHIYH